MTTAPTHLSTAGAPVPLKRGVLVALLLGAVLARVAAVWSRV